MAFAKYGIASRAPELGRSLLIFASLGVLSKILNIDLSSSEVIGLDINAPQPELISGFLGLIVSYLLVAFSLARIEGMVEQKIDGETDEVSRKVLKSKPLMGLMIAIFPFAILVYLTPFALGIYASILLWPDSISALGALWELSG